MDRSPMAGPSNSAMDVRLHYPDSDPRIARHALRRAAGQLSERGLTSAAKWAWELLIYVPTSRIAAVKSPQEPMMAYDRTIDTPAPVRGSVMPIYPVQSTPAVGLSEDASGRFASLRLPPSPIPGNNSFGAGVHVPVTPMVRGDASSSSSAHVRFAATDATSHLSPVGDASMDGIDAGTGMTSDLLEEEEEDIYHFAKTLFDQHQWERCAALLERHHVRGDKALFLQLYARFLVIERQAEEDYFQIARRSSSSTSGKGKAAHRAELIPLLRKLVDPVDPFLLFLKGVLMRKLGKRLEAIDCLLRSVEALPYNWSAWRELDSALEGDASELDQLAPLLPDSFMTAFFFELFTRGASSILRSEQALQRVDALLHLFPGTPYLLVCRGQTLHLMQEFEASEAAYEAARQVDPYRFDGMADYSNSLFVQLKDEKLALLTHDLAEAGREDAEVCCAVANYHSLRGDNHRAVEVLKRGVRLDPSCASAWILLGHAYIELKDSMAAAEMYRKTLELNPRDVRAWTGLGNTYELNGAWAQALHYHKKAVASSPHDFRFWSSVANCYEKLQQPVQAIECYKRCLLIDDTIDGQLAYMDHVARLYEGLAGEEPEDEGEEQQDDLDGLGPNPGDRSTAHARDLLRACVWHRRIVKSIERSRDEEDSAEYLARVFDHVGSYLIAARWEMGLVTFSSHTAQRMIHLPDHDRSEAVALAQMEVDQDVVRPQMGNLAVAREYLNRVVMTGSEAVLEAEELIDTLGQMAQA